MILYVPSRSQSASGRSLRGRTVVLTERLHDGMQLPPLRDTVYARRRSQADMATRVLAQTTGGPELFQRGAIGWRNQLRGTAPLNARHPPSHLARRVWHLALGAGCRGVIGPEPSTSPDVERTCPRPPGSIHHAPSSHVRGRRCGARAPRPAAARVTGRRALGRAPQGRVLALPVCRWLAPPYLRLPWVAVDSRCLSRTRAP